MSNACSMRRVLRRLSMWASAYNCAIVLIGHLNKKTGGKELYRGLGSIDVVATARSVLQIERDSIDDNIRIIKHVKSSLAQKGKDMCFSISETGTIVWCSSSEKTTHSGNDTSEIVPGKMNKQEMAVDYLKNMLSSGEIEAGIVKNELAEMGIGNRTIMIAKDAIDIISTRKNGKWYWSLPNIGEKNGKEI